MRRLLVACAAPIVLLGLAACDATTDPDLGEPVDLSFAPCVGASDSPTWFAFQDGDGSWTRVTASAGAFNFAIASGRGGIAMYTPADGLFIVYATTEELQANLPACGGNVRNVSGTVTGYASLDNIDLSMGNASDFFSGAERTPPADFLIETVDANVTDLVGVRYRSSATTTEFELFPNNIFIRRGVTGTTTPTVDFASSTEAGVPSQRNVSVGAMSAGEYITVLSNIALKTVTANIAVYESSAIASGSVIAPFYGVPASRLETGESQMLVVEALRDINTNTYERRIATSVFVDPTDRTITLGPALGNVTVTGTSRPSATYTIQNEYDNLFDVVFSQGSGLSARQAEVLATRAYLDNATSVTLTVPNLVGVSGFSSSWLLTTGVSSNWNFLATDADLSFLNSKALTYRRADRSSTFTP